jgi:hypothetical protein
MLFGFFIDCLLVYVCQITLTLAYGENSCYLAIWLFGYLAIWLFGYLAIWLFGYSRFIIYLALSKSSYSK